jgi:glycosyltransferase involved in cell wall biosynthesis
MWVRFKETADPRVASYLPPAILARRAVRLLRRMHLAREAQKAGKIGEIFDDRAEYGGDEHRALPDCDVVNVQFSQGFLDHPSFFRDLPADKPVVVTLHEMSWFTGGCSYAGPCTRFHDRCGSCPQLTARGEDDFSRRAWERRRSAFAARPTGKLHFVANSHWTAAMARSSSLLRNYPVTVIHLGVDTDVFRPLDHNASRAAFGIPAGIPVVAFCAASVADERKGIRYLVDAVEQLLEKPFLLTWGRSFPSALEGIPHLHLGNIDSEHLMAFTYNGADIFVMPSLEEAFGQTALEALACGVPVVAFSAGGIPDMVRPDKTGLLVEVGSAPGLASAMLHLLEDRELRSRLGREARLMVEREFSFERNAMAYQKLYSELLEHDRI